ncbi:MAG: CBS domain-containing protein [Candidatus Rokubacteria bacterium]|nr:CBS domain-containing protein [Candidatus Rokubacteria bacterium]MBI2544246.1 CBS domain-containing protein [Candidatus Rokubacteria bacterium]MBI2554663.1 CBS domain-containing protein [Candidatus Rokubacteria bacterium]
MKVEEIMTKDVIAVSPKTAVHEAAELMVDHAISGLPVVDDDGKVVGIVSEGDLILREKPRERTPWWRVFFGDAERLALEYRKAHGTTVEEVMTRSLITVSPDLPIESAALVLDQHRIRRVPVLADGRLVGIVSRGDLIKVLSRAPAPAGGPPSDDRLVREMRARLAQEPWISNRGIVVQAKDGLIALWGLVLTEAEKSALETMARTIEGAKGVESHLVVKSEFPYRYAV